MDCLILGGSGMLGHKIVQEMLASGANVGCTLQGSLHAEKYRSINLFQAVPKVLENFDAMRVDTSLARIDEYRPATIVNCIGIIKQRASAGEALPSITLNALWPHRLAEAAARWGGRVIHFSTDCVFSGSRGGYEESDPSDATDLYGRTKFLGEVNRPNAITLRTSIVGRELFNFQSLLEWFLSMKGSSIHGFRRVMYSGVTTNYLAMAVRRLASDLPKLSGLYQVAGPVISKYELLCEFRRAFDVDVEIEPDDVTVSDRTMNGSRFETATGMKAPPWPHLISEMVTDPTPYMKWQSRSL